MSRQLRCAAIHDISCFGKCSLTVALPVLSAGGIECCCIPTAILSTHTGGFRGYTYRDLTDDIIPIARHWRSEGIALDAFYTGYLGSPSQVEIVRKVFHMLDPDGEALRLVDPVMGDNGRLYSGFAPDFPVLMRELVREADVICPNITEAALLTDSDYRDGVHPEDYIRELVEKLADLGAKRIVLTGVQLCEGELGAAVFEGGDTEFVSSRRVDGMYHGTGDVYASVLLTCLLNSRSLRDSAEFACRFTAKCVEVTKATMPDVNYGVRFEAVLPELMREIEL
ncbi:MAG TPA: pyridoxamine kinase [Firmicutes bacterium]|nr:pyridoxamine kinase [Bacillota bacterium]